MSVKGKTYKEIATKTDIHKTIVSNILNRAKGFGFVIKDKKGGWKKTKVIQGFNLSKLVKANSQAKKGNNKDPLKPLRREHKLPVVSKGAKHARKAAKMAKAYTLLYTVENVLRDLVRKVYKDDPDFWKNKVPQGVRNDVQGIKAKEKYHSTKRSDELEYTHLGHLKDIIVSKSNWADFLLYLHEKDKSSFATVFNRAMPSRHAVAHSIPLTGKDLKVVDVRFTDIIDMLS